MPQTLANSTEFHEKTTSAPESGSEISDMVSSHEIGIEVESLAHETQPPRYEKEQTVEPSAPTEDAGQDDVIFSGEVENISKEQFVSKIAQTIPRLEKIPDYVRQKIAEAMSLLKMDLNQPSLPRKSMAPTSNLTDPLGLEWGAVKYIASFLSKVKKRATQLSIEYGRADNDISTKPHKNLEDLMDTVIHLIIAYNMVRAHTKVKVNGIKGKLTSLKKMRPSKIF
ncbi:hypothetical protein O181_013020 [Austropuccinia psidii MF-1]|uniref:Uncharacterized protein n=1 Tax=Austropuccinia psidii MF-1 TaxID=1389203 RepID=A0A9Q3GNI0_9BASI|nr:hypothetical protein [Austropuccinia psidii MF-1]